MRRFYFYHEASGVLHANAIVISAPDAETVAKLNCPEAHKVIEGALDPLSQRVDISTGQAVDYQPPSPSADHYWSIETKRWQLTPASADRANRKAQATVRIAQLETSQNRALREYALRSDPAIKARLQAIDDEIFSLRSQLG